MKETRLLTLFLASDRDVVLARRKSRDIAAALGFDAQDQARIATSVSEIARNAMVYAGGGEVEFDYSPAAQPTLSVTIRDQGPGIPDLRAVLDQPRVGPGRTVTGLLGARRLVDEFDIQSEPGKGTVVRLGQRLPENAPPLDAAAVRKIALQVRRGETGDPFEEVRSQNQELLKALDEVRRRQEELVRLNQELEDTNRGVVALYAELEEKAGNLRQADQLKTQFLSNMSHEFRTPLNSILGLSRILLAEMDGPLTAEQRKQVDLVARAASELSELINDLLDLAKIEAGKTTVQMSECDLNELFSTLRGMLRPLLTDSPVAMVFEKPEGVPALVTDKTKLSQILRNLISNSVKFTSEGEIRITAACDAGQESVVFRVADTGIGIEAAHHERLFDEFYQVEKSRKTEVKGTGLGLPISRRLARLLGGDVVLERSAPGEGSVFAVTLPAGCSPKLELPAADPQRHTVLVVDDDPTIPVFYEKLLRHTNFRVVGVATVREARAALPKLAPRAVILDLLMPGEDPWAFLADLKHDPAMEKIPVFVATVLTEQRQEVLRLGAEDYCVKPVERGWLLRVLQRAVPAGEAPRILLVDDDETARYIVKRCLDQTMYRISEAANGADGLCLARELKPDAIILDLVMPGMTGFEVLDHLRADEATREIPVIILTSQTLTAEERQGMERSVVAVLGKHRVGGAGGAEDLKETLRRAVSKPSS